MTNAAEPTLTHALLAKALGVTVTTIKSYRRKFPEFFRTASLGKPIRFPADTLALCRRIHHHFKRGLSVEETRRHLGQEFEAHELPPATARAQAPHATPGNSNASLERVEDLLEGLFDLQNRTHSLMAELLAKLDTVADRLGQKQDAGGASAGQARCETRAASAAPEAAPAGTAGRIQRAVDGMIQASAGAASSAGASTLGAGAGSANATPQAPPPFKPDSAQAAQPGSGDGRAASGPRPPAEFLGMPVVVLSPGGDFLGVTSRLGRPFTLEQFEAFLVRRAKDEGGFSAAWIRQGQQWTLRLEGSHGGQDEAREHHFLQAVTPKGNTVARFASLSVNGKPASDADLQAFLRQVKDSLAS